jgi:SAM-dependent methyltransferase
MPSAKDFLNAAHRKLIFGRRARVLANVLSEAFPNDANILDVGTGDGSIAAMIMKLRTDVVIQGVDVLQRPKTHIPVKLFDGRRLPFADCSFDCVMFVDVLHHTLDAEGLLREAARVAGNSVVVKDHLLEGLLARPTLRLMDWVGNRGHDVALPYNYLPRARWDEIVGGAGLQVKFWLDRLKLYPIPATWLFDRRLHFIAQLTKR